jgi:hypothetical protein
MKKYTFITTMEYEFEAENDQEAIKIINNEGTDFLQCNNEWYDKLVEYDNHNKVIESWN